MLGPGLLSQLDCGKALPERGPFSGWGHMKGQGVQELKERKGYFKKVSLRISVYK